MNPEQTAQRKSFGPLIGIIVIVAIVIVGGLYFWSASSKKAAPQDITAATSTAINDLQNEIAAPADVNVDFTDVNSALQQ